VRKLAAWGSLLKPLALRWFPVFFLCGLVFMTVQGSGGLVELWELEQAVEDRRGRLGELNRDNERLLLELEQLDMDPIHLERLVAEELGLVREGGTLFRFDARGVLIEEERPR